MTEFYGDISIEVENEFDTENIVDSEYLKRTTINNINNYLGDNGFISEDYTIEYIGFETPTNVTFTMLTSHLITPSVRTYLEVNNFEWTVTPTNNIV